jgi:hypothetical protein
MKSYILVNPHIEGSIETKYKTNSPAEAANLIYQNMSKYFSNNLPEFTFTLQKGGSDKFYHFHVSEKINKNEKIKFSITEDKSISDINGLTKFITKNKEELAGGRHHSHKSHKSRKYKYDDDDDSSSSSSSNSDDYYYYKPINRNQPISYWSYYPYAYNLRRFYVPTFTLTSPYVYISYIND